jgi:hypothetical protein
MAASPNVVFALIEQITASIQLKDFTILIVSCQQLGVV